MTNRRRSERMHDLRTFAAGAGCGLFAGIVLVWVIGSQYGNPVGSFFQNLRAPAHADPSAGDDAGGAVLENAPEPVEGTTGSVRATEGAARIGPSPSSAAGLEDRDLLMPVEGIDAAQLTSQFGQPRGGSRRHEAIDLLAPRNAPVRAVENGTIARLFHSKAGGITIYQFDPTEQFCYYYAHLERYAPGLKEGDRVRRGQVIGYVGTSGNAPKDTPHLHFAIFRLTAEKRWWEGTPIDPYDVLR
jgi:murein DD-endopeptidase MepM/ murein hydrolase activator NlpD